MAKLTRKEKIALLERQLADTKLALIKEALNFNPERADDLYWAAEFYAATKKLVDAVKGGKRI